MTFRRYCAVSGTLFALVAIAHLLRVIYDIPIMIDTYAVPMYLSWFAIVVPGVLAFFALRLAR